MRRSAWARALLLVTLATSARAIAAPDRAHPPTPGPVPPFVVPVPDELRLDNGVRVRFVHRTRAPLVDVVVRSDGGRLLDPVDRPGLVHFTTTMMMRGAGTRDALAFDDDTRALGADVNVGASDTSSFLRLHVTSSRLQPALALAADALLRPRLDDDEWHKAQDELRGALASMRDDPRSIAAAAVAHVLHGPASPLGHLPDGTRASLDATTTADLRACASRLFAPSRMTITIVGDVDPARAIVLLQEAFGAMREPAAPTSIAHAPEPAAVDALRITLVDRPGAAQSVVRVVWPLPSTLQPLDPDLRVLQTMLGGSFTSRLNTNLREVHGYSYGASFAVRDFPVHTALVGTSVATDVTVPALREVLHELERIRTRASDEEVARARSYAALDLPSRFDGGAMVASALDGWDEQGITLQRVQALMPELLHVDAAHVQAMAGRAVDAQRAHIVIVGDAARLQHDLQAVAPITRLDVDTVLPP